MGDDELNFTEDEARCWADDPRNQPCADSLRPMLLIICVSLLVALMTFSLAHSSHSPVPDGVSRAERGQVGDPPDHRSNDAGR